MSSTLVVLRPGPTPRVLGSSARTRNERVAARAGAVQITAESLRNHGDTPAVIVPVGIIIDGPLFPLPPLKQPVWLVGQSAAAVLAGPARQLAPYADKPELANTLRRVAVPGGAVLDVSTVSARRRAAWDVLLRTGKPTDGWVSQHFGRPISRVLSFLMLSMGLTANQASLITLLIGFATGAVALRPGYLPFLGTGILFQLTSVLDGVDGEMARATLTESERGALLDTIVDQLSYLACFAGVTIGWIREGAGVAGVMWTVVVAIALVLSMMRAWRFVSRYAPNASFVFVDRAVRRAARDSGRAALKVVSALFTLLRRDAFATLFFFYAIVGQRALIPATCALGVVLTNVTLSRYRRELAAAAVAIQRT